MNNEETQYQKKLIEIVKNFNNSPFLFIGAGFSKRYLETPSWPNLLEYFAKKVKPTDPLAYATYINLGKNDNAQIGSLIADDFNKLWFNDMKFRNENPKEIIEYIKENQQGSPFHAAVAEYLKSFKIIKNKYKDEIDDFKILRGNSIEGIITTNYDNLLEDLTQYESYVGQTELLASSPIGIGEIYKIHGAVNKPDSMVITKEDYDLFNDKAQYLSAKLITIFIENPIFFIGYSLNDSNIRKIIDTIIHCFDSTDTDLFHKFSQKLFFVNYEENSKLSISDLDYSDKLKLVKITVSDFSIVYKALLNHRQQIPVKTMRKLKKDFCKFTETNIPTTSVQVMNVDNEKLSDKDLAIWIGTQEKINKIEGHSPIPRDNIFLDIILDNIEGTNSDDILNNFFPTYSGNMEQTPPCKYIASATKEYPSDIVIPNYNDSLKKGNSFPSSIKDKSIKGIFASDKEFHLKLDYIAYLQEDQIDTDDLEFQLKDLFSKYPDIFEKIPEIIEDGKNYKTQLRKAIRIYDYKKYSEKAKINLNNLKKNKSHEESSS
ncbi:MAG: SIR2 family protein [Sphaerochaeta sp.]